MIDCLITLQKHEELINNYYTPFIKSKLNNNIELFDKELKDLDKQIDRIKTAYIKGITKIDYFEKELNQIEMRKEEIRTKIKEQQQYDNLSFTLDDLVIFEDTQTINFLNNPSSYLSIISDWLILSKKEKQKLISHYIDNIEIERKNDDFVIKNINFLSSYTKEQVKNHLEYNTPLNFYLFRCGNLDIKISSESKTSEQAKKYFDKLDKYVNTISTSKLNYKEMIYDFNSDNNIVNKDPVIRAIYIKDRKIEKQNKMKIGLITLDIENVKKIYTPKVIKFIFEMSDYYIKEIKKMFHNVKC